MKNRRERGSCIKDSRGFTLVEMIIAIAILSIVAASITSFIVSGSRSYAASNTEIVVQQEAQLAMNQISDVIIDTTRSVNYVGYSADGSVSEQALKDADFTIDVEDKSLTLFNGAGTVVVDAHGNPVLDADGNPEIAKDALGNPIINGGNGNQHNFQFYYDKSEEKLYYSEIDLSQDVFPQTEADGMVLLAEFVKDFSVDLTQVEEKRVVQITVVYEYNHKVYETSNNITIRNKVLVNNVNLAVNRTVELSIRPRENMVVLEPGENYYRFSTPIVEGRNVMDKSVTWSIPAEEQANLTGADTGFTDTATGIIHISSAEQVNSFKVLVTTNEVDSSGNHASAEVVVYVKRAKAVNLYKSADSDANNGSHTISPGCTFTISANVTGNKLEVTCSNCGDDTVIDKQVSYEGNPYGNPYVWLIYKDLENGWDPTQWLTMVSSDAYSATFKLSEDAPNDGSHKYVIQCMSLLSTQGNAYGRQYDNWVPGAIELTVGNNNANISLGGDIRYGSATKVNVNVPEFNKAGQGYYIVCARIKEDPHAPVSSDRVILYGTNGNDTWLTPDVFGLENMNKDYYISIQLLDQGRQLHTWDSDYDTVVDEIKTEYQNNLDSTGTYIGNKYPASDKISFTLYTPQIAYEYNDKVYEGTSVNIDTIYAAYAASCGGATVNCPVKYVTNVKEQNFLSSGNVLYGVYKGEGNDSSKWTFICGYKTDSSGNFNGNYTGSSQYGALDFNDFKTDPQQLKVKLDQNQTMNAVGTYHYVPYLRYANDKAADHGYTVYWSNYTPEYGVTHYYERKDSTVNFTIAGGNMTLTAYANNSMRTGVIWFPTPSDTGGNGFTKYFDLNNTELQYSKQKWVGFNLYEEGGTQGNWVKVPDMTCRYIASENAYEIEIFYAGKNDVVYSAGKFKCGANGTEWRIVSAGTEQVK